MLDLNLVPAGTDIFVDTNIFHFAFQGKSPACIHFLERIARNEIEAYVNIQVLADLLHKLMFAEALVKGCTRSTNPQELKRYLKDCRANRLELLLTDYQAQFETIIALGLPVLPINEQLLIETKAERARYYLMTGDSVHLGTMVRRKVNRRKVPLQHIATYDGDFAYISDLTVWKPLDISNQRQPGVAYAHP